jgi:hypothetical protein
VQDLHDDFDDADRGLLRRSLRIRAAAAIAVACGLCSCDRHDSRRATVDPPPATSVSAPAPSVATPSVAARPFDGPDWDAVRLVDEIPLCVFSDHDERGNAPFLKDVHRQKLAAGAKVVFGTFAPGCVAEECDAIPTETCWVDSEGPRTLVVHSLLSFRHRHGSTCNTDCRPIVAGCESAALAAGKYTVKYGSRSFELRVPGVVSSPCFDLR